MRSEPGGYSDSESSDDDFEQIQHGELTGFNEENLTDQTIEQPISHPTDQTIEQSISQPTNQTIEQQISQSTDQTIDQSISQTMEQPISQPTDKTRYHQHMSSEVTKQNPYSDVCSDSAQ